METDEDSEAVELECVQKRFDHGYARFFRDLAHPTRLELLRTLSHRDVSPSQFARHHGVPVSSVTYHFRVLRESGWISLVRTRPAGGSVEHIYRQVPQTEGLLSPCGSQLIWRALTLDEQGAREVRVVLRDAWDAVVRAEAMAVERLRAEQSAGLAAMVSLLGFELSGSVRG